MKKKSPLLFSIVFFFAGLYSFASVGIEPQYSGTDCARTAIQLYDYLVHSEIDTNAAYLQSLDFYNECLEQQ